MNTKRYLQSWDEELNEGLGDNIKAAGKKVFDVSKAMWNGITKPLRSYYARVEAQKELIKKFNNQLENREVKDADYKNYVERKNLAKEELKKITKEENPIKNTFKRFISILCLITMFGYLIQGCCGSRMPSQNTKNINLEYAEGIYKRLGGTKEEYKEQRNQDHLKIVNMASVMKEFEDLVKNIRWATDKDGKRRPVTPEDRAKLVELMNKMEKMARDAGVDFDRNNFMNAITKIPARFLQNTSDEIWKWFNSFNVDFSKVYNQKNDNTYFWGDESSYEKKD